MNCCDRSQSSATTSTARTAPPATTTATATATTATGPTAPIVSPQSSTASSAVAQSVEPSSVASRSASTSSSISGVDQSAKPQQCVPALVAQAPAAGASSDAQGVHTEISEPPAFELVRPGAEMAAALATDTNPAAAAATAGGTRIMDGDDEVTETVTSATAISVTAMYVTVCRSSLQLCNSIERA
jgi:hypothetical protein